MKVLYISNFRDGTGWSNAALGYILSMDAVGINVVPRAIKLNNVQGEVPDRIVELESQDDNGCDIVIQNVLPPFMEYSGKFAKNIGLCYTETNSLGVTKWADHLNLMDENWVCCKANAKCLTNSGVKTPITVLPCPCDMSKYEQVYEPIPIPEIKDKFTFYYIGEISRRKNVVAMMKAFHLAFRRTDDVALVIKGNIPGASPQETGQQITDLANMVKDNLKLYPHRHQYMNEVIISAPMSNEEIMRLHSTCDCFVMPSFGEAWSIPTFDSMAMGKTPICNCTGGMLDFVRHGGWMVKNHQEPCFGDLDTIPDLHTGHEQWDAIDIEDLVRSMREAYHSLPTRLEKSACGIDNAYQYSYVNVGQQILKALQ